jgi:hypothetical protein
MRQWYNFRVERKPANSFFTSPLGKITLVNLGTGLGLFVAWIHGYRGLSFVFLTITSVVILNAVGLVGILFGKRASSNSSNRFLKPLWIAVGILWLIYLLDYIFPAK